MKVRDLHFQSPQRIEPPVRPQRPDGGAGRPDAVRPGEETRKPFGSVLQEQMRPSEIRFSAHAMQRIEERQMAVSAAELSRLEDGMRAVDAKGAQNALILVDETAFIVSVKNRTVVTAIDQATQTKPVFTNIDSVAIV